MDTSSPEYEQNIIMRLYNNKPLYKKIMISIHKLARKIILFVLDYYEKYTTTMDDSDILRILENTFFSNNKKEAGQIGYWKPETVTNISEYREWLLEFIKDFNLREMMTFIMNFYKDRNNVGTAAVVYNSLLQYKTKGEIYQLQKEYATKRIKIIENLLGFDMEETLECVHFTEWCDINDRALYKYRDFPTIMSLSFPTLFLYGEYIITNPSSSWKGDISRILKTSKLRKEPKSVTGGCGDRLDSLLIPLSERENTFLSGDIVDNYLPWIPGACWYDKIDSFANDVYNHYGKYTIANVSGHTFLHMDVVRFFLSSKEDIMLNILACLIWMVPKDHSINEILTATRIMDIFDYEYKQTSEYNVNKLLGQI